jgi:hypothetical protein
MKAFHWSVVLLGAGLLMMLSTTLCSAENDPWKNLRFLEGTWNAKTSGGSAGAQTEGTYTFQFELGGHILARHSTNNAGCKGPADYNCDHHDLLYVYQEAPDQPLQAIYFDSEGHVVHYNVSAPEPQTAIFLSEASVPGPQFRLTYKLAGTAMSGTFQMRMPPGSDWKSYLEWSGTKK